MSLTAVLITGTSHTGKTTLGDELSGLLDWPLLSTDSLGRHPGRPWPAPKPHVAEVYSRLSAQSLQTLLSHHHGTMAPVIKARLAERPLVFEGNALRPELFAEVRDTLGVLLDLSDADIRTRIQAASDYATRPPDHQGIIDGFIGRCLLDQSALRLAAKEAGWLCLPVDERHNSANFLLSKIHADESPSTL